MVATPCFAGFPDGKGRFFQQLAKNQDREWFLAHKQEFQRDYEAPLKALLLEVAEAVQPAYPIALAQPKIFRIQRDVRFSANKSPYKTHIGGVLYLDMGLGQMEAPSPLYVQIGSDKSRTERHAGSFCAAGHYMMSPPQLSNFREAVANDAGVALSKAIARLVKAGYEISSFESLKKVPRGYDPEHPRAELLKMKGLVVTFPSIPLETYQTPALAKTLAAHAKAVAPVVRWLAENVCGE